MDILLKEMVRTLQKWQGRERHAEERFQIEGINAV